MSLSIHYQFVNVQSSFYWSSSSSVSIPNSAWDVSLSNGVVSFLFKGNFNFVCPVRGGQ